MVNIILPATAAAAFAAKAWDYVIVGGGTAGLALATRLSENPALQVAVLEAGVDQSDDPNIKIAGNWATTYQNPQYNWGFSTVPQTSAAGQSIAQPRGKVLGGSSAINAMEWRIASKPEYDAISSFGISGWGYDDLLPYFKKAQTFVPQTNNPLFPGAGGSAPDKGTSGPLLVTFNTWYSSLTAYFLDSVQSLGFGAANPDPEGGDASGVANIPRTASNVDSTRQFSAVTYLPQAQDRSNIQVLTGAQATKVTFKSIKGNLVASGVQFVANGQNFTVSAGKEVILSAGTFQTPQLLELSGIGQTSVLNKYGIPTLVDLPGVGENLQDHLFISMEFTLNAVAQAHLTLQSVPADLQSIPGKTDAASSMTGTPFLWAPMKPVASSSGYSDLLATLDSYLSSNSLTPLERAQFQVQRQWLASSKGSSGYTVPDVEIIFAAYPGTPGLPLPDGTLGAWMPSAHVHPTSRGSVHLVSASALAAPAIDPKYLSRDYDLKALSQIVRFAQKLSQTGSLVSSINGALAPPTNISDADLLEFIKANIATQFHPVGTAAMASRSLGGVVDANLLVYGTANLRVVDASVIPLVLAATMQATTYAIAEKAADIIKGAA